LVMDGKSVGIPKSQLSFFPKHCQPRLVCPTWSTVGRALCSRSIGKGPKSRRGLHSRAGISNAIVLPTHATETRFGLRKTQNPNKFCLFRLVSEQPWMPCIPLRMPALPTRTASHGRNGNSLAFRLQLNCMRTAASPPALGRTMYPAKA